MGCRNGPIQLNTCSQSDKGVAVVGDPESENVSSPTEVGSPGSRMIPRGMLHNLYATSIPAPPSLPSRYTQSYATPRTLGSDRVPVSAPIVVPQGLALLLVDAATQTDPDDA
nr:hypothetical protein [Tanacetum cinerariifolium]